jgi:hypothetical protein
MYGEPRRVVVELSGGRSVTVKLTGRAALGARSILLRAFRDGRPDSASLGMAAAVMLPDLLETGLVVGWAGFVGADGRPLPLQPALLADLLDEADVSALVGEVITECNPAALSPAAAAAAEEIGDPDPTPNAPTQT